jgi:hypothetical protein
MELVILGAQAVSDLINTTSKTQATEQSEGIDMYVISCNKSIAAQENRIMMAKGICSLLEVTPVATEFILHTLLYVSVLSAFRSPGGYVRTLYGRFFLCGKVVHERILVPL